MKYILPYSLLSVLGLCMTQAQVGVNTLNPKGVLHIETGVVGDTSDDVIIDNTGRVGIGTGTPQMKLHIKSKTVTRAIGIKDGAEGNYKMLVSDSNGVGTWGFLGLPVVKGVLSASGKNYYVKDLGMPAGTTNEMLIPHHPLDATITLPPGRWCVYLNLLIGVSGALSTEDYSVNTWMRLSYSDSYGGPASPDIIGAPWSSGTVYAKSWGVIQGFVVIRNAGSASKVYHLGIVYANAGRLSNGVLLSSIATSTKGENGIIAVKIGEN